MSLNVQVCRPGSPGRGIAAELSHSLCCPQQHDGDWGKHCIPRGQEHPALMHPEAQDMLLPGIPVRLLLVGDTAGEVSAGASTRVWVSAGMCRGGALACGAAGVLSPSLPCVSQQPLPGPTTLPELTLLLLPHLHSHLRRKQLLPCPQHCGIWGLPSGWFCPPWSICWPGPWPPPVAVTDTARGGDRTPRGA